jgi:hypothetical protein
MGNWEFSCYSMLFFSTKVWYQCLCTSVSPNRTTEQEQPQYPLVKRVIHSLKTQYTQHTHLITKFHHSHLRHHRKKYREYIEPISIILDASNHPHYTHVMEPKTMPTTKIQNTLLYDKSPCAFTKFKRSNTHYSLINS